MSGQDAEEDGGEVVVFQGLRVTLPAKARPRLAGGRVLLTLKHRSGLAAGLVTSGKWVRAAAQRGTDGQGVRSDVVERGNGRYVREMSNR